MHPGGSAVMTGFRPRERYDRKQRRDGRASRATLEGTSLMATVWIFAGSLCYVVIAAGLYLKLKAAGKPLLPFLILAVVAYVPFVGYPFLQSPGKAVENERAITVYRVAMAKAELGIIDKGLNIPKEDRYLSAEELGRLIVHLAKTALPQAPTEEDRTHPRQVCQYLYLYGWFLTAEGLSLNRKWNAAFDMPRRFYREEGAPPFLPAADYAVLEREVAAAWRALPQRLPSLSAVAACPGPQ